MTDPDDIDVDPKATYVRLHAHHGASKIGNPLVDEDDEGIWRGALEYARSMVSDGGPDRRLDVDHVTRGGWGFPFVKTRDAELVDALADEGNEPIPGEEFADLLDEAPAYTYLRAARERIAERATSQYRHLEIVEPDDLDAPTVTAEVSNQSE